MKKFWLALIIVCLALLTAAVFIHLVTVKTNPNWPVFQENRFSPWYWLLLPAGVGGGVLGKIWREEHGSDESCPDWQSPEK